MLESAFFSFDEDGSGEMDAQELAGAAQVMGLQMKSEDVDDMIKVIDRDGSGTSKTPQPTIPVCFALRLFSTFSFVCSRHGRIQDRHGCNNCRE